MRGEETEKKGECAVEYLLLAPLVIEVLKFRCLIIYISN